MGQIMGNYEGVHVELMLCSLELIYTTYCIGAQLVITYFLHRNVMMLLVIKRGPTLLREPKKAYRSSGKPSFLGNSPYFFNCTMPFLLKVQVSGVFLIPPDLVLYRCESFYLVCQGVFRMGLMPLTVFRAVGVTWAMKALQRN